MMKRLPTSIGVLGSCVSDDIFRYIHDGVLRCTMAMRDVSILGVTRERPAFSLRVEHASSLHTKWMQVCWDGQVLDFLEEHKGEYLLIDLVDERFDLVEVEQGVFNGHFFGETNMPELVRNRGVTAREVRQEDIPEKVVRERIQRACRELLQVYPPENIIVNEFYLAHTYLRDGKICAFDRASDLWVIKRSDAYFRQRYRILEEALPGCRILRLPRTYHGDFHHPRGLSPTHLTIDYYRDIYDAILNIAEMDRRARRSVPVGSLPVGRKSPIAWKDMLRFGLQEYTAKLFQRILSLADLDGKTMLYLGDRMISHAFVRSRRIRKFVQIIDCKKYPKGYRDTKRRIYDFHAGYRAPGEILQTNNFVYYDGSIFDMTPDFCSMFDVVFLDNIEELDPMEDVLERVYQILRPLGRLLAKTGRTWSSAGGSKWRMDGKENYMTSGRLDFCHLFPKDACAEMLRRRGMDTGVFAKAVAGSQTMNKMFYRDYVRLLQDSAFRTKSISPMFRYDVEAGMLDRLKRQYPGTSDADFSYKSLFLMCMK